jgi:ribosomal protein S18 acetylase RimI-like enzyme
VTIRQAAEGDYNALCALFEAADEHNCAMAPEVYRRPQHPARSPEYLSRAIAGGPSSLLVAERAGAVVGMARVAVAVVPATTDGHVAQVGYVYVDERARRQGVGHALMEGCHEWIREREGRRVYIPVLVGDAEALSFFRDLGYVDRGDIDSMGLSDTGDADEPNTREAVEADYPAVSALFDETTQFHHDIAPNEYSEPTPPALSQERFQQFVEADGATFLVAERDSVVVAIVEARVIPSIVFAGGRYGSVMALHVSNACRGGGVGSGLMRRCHQHDVPRAHLRVIGENAGAKAFYRRIGYAPQALEMVCQLH